MELGDGVFVKFSILIVFCCLAKCSTINQSVDRSLDLSSQLVKESLKVVAESITKDPIKEYTFLVPDEYADNLSYISATDASKKELKIKEITSKSGRQYAIAFQSPSVVQTFTVDVVYSKSLQPHPLEIRQSDKQLVKYQGLLHYYSAYKTVTQKTSIKLSSSNIISYTQLKNGVATGNKIKYGPFNDIEPLSNKPFAVHYENETPFLTVRRLERIIELSHWGNIAIKENIHVDHTGAQLKGSFSRYEFQKDGQSGLSSVKSYKTILPASASDVYYRDSNGNISTSNMKILHDHVELELRPRFPLFGGWKNQYILGYNVPSFEYLFNSNDDYLLKMRVVDHIYDNMVIDELEVKIILPESCNNIKLITPYPVNRQPDELHYTYLDTVGRPVISFTKKNLVENHIADFNLKYKFSALSLLLEPLLVIGFIFIIFIITIIVLRLDFTISNQHHNHAHKE